MIKVQRFITAAPIGVPLWIITAPAGAGDVIETMGDVSGSGQFEIDAFATAIEAAGLAEELEGAGPYTIFAPTNEAFEMLKLGGVEVGARPRRRRNSSNRQIRIGSPRY